MKKKVVLVQDNEDILEIMDQVLEDEGFDVTSSLTTEPIKNLDKIDPDVIVIDDHIKGNVKGSKVVKELKENPETEDLSVVLTSTSDKLPQQAKECNADDFIEKPFDIDHMVDVVKRNAEA
ncbi:two-component system response regulator [Pedobacter nototheniae]|uniref:response regulator n=1 Tax=Pedobacter nototheniae TaxID=2488994 RepID=UPI00292DC647|nr:response regulator [Pedobacter nototheniae]